MSDKTPTSTDAAREQSLKLRLLELQTEEKEIVIAKAKRDEKFQQDDQALKLRQQTAATERAELELSNLKRESAKANADAQEALTYTFYDGVSAESIKPALAELGRWTRRFPGKPIKLIVNSPGGSVIAGLALFDYIQELRANGHHVTVVALGMAASMGGILLQAGDKRVIGKHAMLLIHEVSSGTSGKVSEMGDSLEFSNKLWDKLSKILAERSKLSPAQVKRKSYKKDWWLDAEEAVELGFADEIL